MVQTARGQGRETLEFADEMSGYFRAMCDGLDISYDAFVRTSEERHHAASIALWKAMEANGDLYLDRYEGWYSVRDEAYYDESELTEGEGGHKLSPQGTPVEWTVEESWFFRLSRYQEPLLAHYRDNPGFIRPESRRQPVTQQNRRGIAPADAFVRAELPALAQRQNTRAIRHVAAVGRGEAQGPGQRVAGWLAGQTGSRPGGTQRIDFQIFGRRQYRA